jgi:steroid 5-alpha reductase family enzyme
MPSHFSINLLQNFSIALASCFACSFLVWLASVRRHNVAYADRAWGLLILLSALIFSFATSSSAPSARVIVMLIVVAVWALRLSLFITWRSWGKAEDRRYADMRERNQPYFVLKSLYLVFALQALLACIVAMPFLAAVAAVGATNSWSWLDSAGMALAVFGVVFEIIADTQMAAFKKQLRSSDKVMQTGLWRFSRHPNYFGESCLWFGLYIMALSAGGWWALISPVMITFLLLKVSGINLQEQNLQGRSQEYIDYFGRTAAFVPWPPKLADL